MAVFFNQPSFASGEIGPHLYGRVDQELYYIGLRSCRNFIVRQFGGVTNRPGSYFIAESRDSAHKTRLIDFQFNEVQTYCLEFGHQFLRVIKNGGEVLETAFVKNITGATNAANVVITSVAHGFSNGDDVYIAAMIGMTEMNGRTLRVSDVAANTFKLKDFQGNYIDSTAYGVWTSAGTASRIYTVTTPWTEDALFNLNYAQSADVLTVVHPTYPIYDITRTAHDAWTVSAFNPVNGPFKDVNVTTTTVAPSAISGVGITLTASAALFNANDVGTLMYIEQMTNDTTKTWEVAKAIVINDIRRAGFNYYQATNNATTGTVKPDHTDGTQTDGDNGVIWKYLHSGFGIVKITAYTDTTHVTADVIKRLPDNLLTTASTNWAKAAWSVTEGYPAAVAYHKQRLWLGGATNAPNDLWTSNVGLRTQFGSSNPILDDESITLALDTTQVNAVRHLCSLGGLIILTSSSQQLITGDSNGAILATAPPKPKVQGYDGSGKIHPIIIGNTGLYVEDTGDLVRSIQYDLSTDSFTGIDLTARSPHLFQNRTIVDWAYQKRPLSVVWTVMSDGALLGFTYMQEQKVYAWSRHDTQGTYESVCCIREGNETSAYKLVRRLVNGTYRRYIERDSTRYFSRVEDCHFVDSGLSYDGRNTTATTITITGGTTWDTPEVLTLTASASIFVATDLNNAITFVNGDVTYRLIINGFISGTQVTAVPTKMLPVAYRSVARTDWNFARLKFGPFHHIEGMNVSVLADGNVIENMSISNGQLVLPRPAAVMHGGLFYLPELETLDLAQPQGNGKAKSVNIPRLFITVQESRAAFVATTKYGNTSQTATTNVKAALIADKFYEIKALQRDDSIGYDKPIQMTTDLIEVNTGGSWSNKGRICLRHPFPLPITINCITDEVPVGYS